MLQTSMSKLDALIFWAKYNPKIIAGTSGAEDKNFMFARIEEETDPDVRQTLFAKKGVNLTHDADFLIQVGLIYLSILVQDDIVQKLKSDYITEVLLGIIRLKPEVLTDANLSIFFKRDYTIFDTCLWAVHHFNTQNPNSHYKNFLNH
jgi:hypothetical protein